MLASVVNQLAINFVANHPKLMLLCKRRDFFQFLFGNHRSRGIVGRANHQGLCLWRDKFFDSGSRRIKIGLSCVQRNGLGLAKLRQRNVVYVTGLAYDDFVAGIKNRAQNRVNAFAGSDRDEYFVFGLVRHVVAREVFCNLFAQLNQAPV